VLEKLGARTAIVTTQGFRDVLELRRMRMPHLYDYYWRKPAPLVPRRLRFEVDERVSASGERLRSLTVEDARRVARELREARVESVAVCLLHAHLFPAHERLLGEVLREELPDVPISLSCEILREQQEYERTATTTVNAYIRPLMTGYLDDIRSGIAEFAGAVPLQIMQSSGGVMTSADAAVRPVYALESGPAAGVVASLGLAQALGFQNVITFDMGGTTDYMDSDGIDVCDVPLTVHLTIAGDEIVADFSDCAPMVPGVAQLHPIVRGSQRLPHDHGRLHDGYPSHGRRNEAHHGHHEARHRHARCHARGLLDARCHRLPALGRDERRSRADHSQPGPRRR